MQLRTISSGIVIFFLCKRRVWLWGRSLPLAKLFMGKWEDIYAQPRPALVLCARYIDDVLLCNGTLDSLHIFMENLNNNDRGIEFKY